MSAHAAVEVDERRDVLAVPLQALVRRSLKDFLARPEDLAKRPSGVEAAAEPGAGGAPTAGEGLEAGKDPKREQVQVALVDRGGRAEMVKVRTGISDAFRVEILEGLREGDRLILGPYRRLRSLKNGDPVRRVEKEEIREADEGSRD
jgi:HlyD family secretion protein